MAYVATAAAAVMLVALAAHPSRAQDVIWSDQFGTATYDFTGSVDVLDGNVYIVGSTYGALGASPDGGLDGFLSRRRPGQVVWTKQFGYGYHEFATDVNAASSQAIDVVGYSPGSSAPFVEAKAYIRRYTETGSFVWGHTFGPAAGLSVAGTQSAVFVASTTDGSLGSPSAGFTDGFLRRYDQSGSPVWTRQLGSDGHDDVAGVAVSGSAIYVAGTAHGALPGQTDSGTADAFVARYDASGILIWTRQFDTGLTDWATGVTTDFEGNVYVTGSTLGTFPGQTSSGARDAFVRRYDADGTLGWTRQFGTTKEEIAWDVTSDQHGVYVAGDTWGTLPGQAAGGKRDGFVRRFALDGKVQWTVQFGGAANDSFTGVASGNNRAIYVAGWTEGSLPGSVSAGGDDAFWIGFRQRSCWDTSNPQGQESGSVSSTAHQHETNAGALEPTVHAVNCTVIVPAGL